MGHVQRARCQSNQRHRTAVHRNGGHSRGAAKGSREGGHKRRATKGERARCTALGLGWQVCCWLHLDELAGDLALELVDVAAHPALNRVGQLGQLGVAGHEHLVRRSTRQHTSAHVTLGQPGVAWHAHLVRSPCHASGAPKHPQMSPRNPTHSGGIVGAPGACDWCLTRTRTMFRRQSRAVGHPACGAWRGMCRAVRGA